MADSKQLSALLPKTRKVFNNLVSKDILSNFVLVGGSALALHLNHRKSDDLDFFTYDIDSFQTKQLLKLLNEFNAAIVNISNEQIDAIVDGVKVTFFDAKWEFLQPQKIHRCNIASLEQLAIMKTHVLFLRAKFRDYYDLYFVIKQFGLQTVYELSKEILEGINFKLFAAALLYIEDIEDENIEHLEPKLSLSLKEIQNFFSNELKKI